MPLQWHHSVRISTVLKSMRPNGKERWIDLTENIRIFDFSNAEQWIIAFFRHWRQQNDLSLWFFFVCKPTLLHLCQLCICTALLFIYIFCTLCCCYFTPLYMLFFCTRSLFLFYLPGFLSMLTMKMETLMHPCIIQTHTVLHTCSHTFRGKFLKSLQALITYSCAPTHTPTIGDCI